jgi:hypothetical protein
MFLVEILPKGDVLVWNGAGNLRTELHYPGKLISK